MGKDKKKEKAEKDKKKDKDSEKQKDEKGKDKKKDTESSKSKTTQGSEKDKKKDAESNKSKTGQETGKHKSKDKVPVSPQVAAKKVDSKQKGKDEDTKAGPKISPEILLQLLPPPPKLKLPNFSEDVYRAFRPYRAMLLAVGRFPVSSKKTNKIYVYSNSLCSLSGLWFLFVSFIIAYTLIFGTIGFCSVVLTPDQKVNFTEVFDKTPGNSPIKCDKRNPGSECEWHWGKLIHRKQLSVMHLRERTLYKRHEVSFIVIWTSLILAAVGSLNMFLKREYFVNFLNFWSRAVYTMHMDVSKGLHIYSIVTLAFYLLIISAQLTLGALKIGQTSSGAPTLMALFMFKWHDPLMLAPPDLNHLDKVREKDIIIYQWVAGFTILFIFIVSRSYVFMFLFKCKLLQNAFAAWNGRVYAAVLRGGEYSQTIEGRTLFSLLFKDHCVLLDLLEGTDQFFSGVIESYYGLQIASICFEIFFLLRVAKEGNNRDGAYKYGFFMRPQDWAPALLILFQSMTLLWIVSKAAAAVGEEAIAGLEVIRRKTMLGRKTDEELYFALSMYSSYTAFKKLEVSGGGYFYLNKEFIVGVVSTILSYFIIIYQFNPKLDFELPGAGVDSSSEERREAAGKFLSKIEKLVDDHWISNE